MPTWVRGEETAEIVAPFPQKLAVTALGNSGATPPAGITAEVVGFDSLAELEAAPRRGGRAARSSSSATQMTPTQDGSSYGYFGAARRTGPTVARRKGAAAIVIRSIGTDYHRNPHTGVHDLGEGVTPIPAGALCRSPTPRISSACCSAGKPVTMRLRPHPALHRRAGHPATSSPKCRAAIPTPGSC